MKKKVKWASCIVIVAIPTLFSNTSTASATGETATQEITAKVEDGGISIQAAYMEMSFDNIKFGDGNTSYINPTIKQSSIVDSTYSDMVGVYNIYDPNLFPVQPEQPLPYTQARDYMIKVRNNNSSSPEFKVKVSRTDFANVATGEKMKGEGFYIGNFKDNMDYKGLKRSQDIGEKDKYWLSEATEVSKNQSVLVADYRGNSGLGEHWLSPFTPENVSSEGYIMVKSDIVEYEKNFTYREENISLGIDQDTQIPKAGSYSTTLTWTIEQSI